MCHHFLCPGSYGLRCQTAPREDLGAIMGWEEEEEEDEHIGRGPAVQMSTRTIKFIKEKEQAGRGESMGI